MITMMDKDILVAFVDGELSPEDAARVVLHLADHPQDQAWVDDLYAANEALAQAFAGPIHEPVPEAIRAAIMQPEATNVVAFRPRSRVSLAIGGLALAASVAAAALLLPGLITGSAAQGLVLGPLAAADPVAGVLEGNASGIVVQLADGRESMVLATYSMADGQYCREVEVVDQTAGRVDYAVGCRAEGVWTIEAAIAEVVDSSADQGFVTAGGAEVDTLTRFLERGAAPVALDAATEADAIMNSWSDR